MERRERKCRPKPKEKPQVSINLRQDEIEKRQRKLFARSRNVIGPYDIVVNQAAGKVKLEPLEGKIKVEPGVVAKTSSSDHQPIVKSEKNQSTSSSDSSSDSSDSEEERERAQQVVRVVKMELDISEESNDDPKQQVVTEEDISSANNDLHQDDVEEDVVDASSNDDDEVRDNVQQGLKTENPPSLIINDVKRSDIAQGPDMSPQQSKKSPKSKTKMTNSIKLKSSDDLELTVDMNVAILSTTIKAKLKNIEKEQKEKVIPLGNITGKILKKVVKWTAHHQDDRHPPTQNNGNKMSDWDEKFFQVDNETLFALSRAADYLDIKGLMDVTGVEVVNRVMGKTPREIRDLFGLPWPVV